VTVRRSMEAVCFCLQKHVCSLVAFGCLYSLELLHDRTVQKKNYTARA
jgi:hypothetical protein